MKEINVGEYIRSKDGYIAKIIEVKKSKRDCDTYYCTDRIMANGFYEHIKKHRPNIIDLIEEGDYVNGYKVLDVVEDMKTGELHLEMPMDYTNPELGDCTIYNKDIKNVVTKEQFQRMEYIVGDESNESNSNTL